MRCTQKNAVPGAMVITGLQVVWSNCVPSVKTSLSSVSRMSRRMCQYWKTEMKLCLQHPSGNTTETKPLDWLYQFTFVIAVMLFLGLTSHENMWVQECLLEWASPCNHILCAVDPKGLQIPTVMKPLNLCKEACGISTSPSKLRCPFVSVWPSAFNFSFIQSLHMVWLWHSTLFLTFCLCFLFLMILTQFEEMTFFPNATFDASELKRCPSCPRLPEESTTCPGAGAPSSLACLMAVNSLIMRSSTFSPASMFSPASPYLSVMELSRRNR